MHCPNEFAAGVFVGVLVTLVVIGLALTWLSLSDRP